MILTPFTNVTTYHGHPQAWQGGTCSPSFSPPLEMLKSVFCCKCCTSFWENVVSFWGLRPRHPPGSCPWTLLGDFRPSDSLIAHPWKNPAGVHATYFLTLVSYWLHSCFCFFVAFSPYLNVCIFLFFAVTSWRINIYTRIYSASNNSPGVDSILCSMLTLCARYTWFRTMTKCQPEYTSLSKSVRTSDMTRPFSRLCSCW